MIHKEETKREMLCWHPEWKNQYYFVHLRLNEGDRLQAEYINTVFDKLKKEKQKKLTCWTESNSDLLWKLQKTHTN